jgi:hypothetical protein
VEEREKDANGEIPSSSRILPRQKHYGGQGGLAHGDRMGKIGQKLYPPSPTTFVKSTTAVRKALRRAGRFFTGFQFGHKKKVLET